MTENKRFNVYLFNGELYTINSDTIAGSPFASFFFIPMYELLKDESLVSDKENLKSFKMSDAEFEKSDATLMGQLSFFAKTSEYVFTFQSGALNPFKSQIPRVSDNAFMVKNKFSDDLTVIPFDSVLYYKISHVAGLIYSVTLFLNNGSTFLIEHLSHDEYYKVLSAFNESKGL